VPAAGLPLEEKESHKTAGHHEGQQQEEDHRREASGQVAALQVAHAGKG
jgi:hypothetical protein